MRNLFNWRKAKMDPITVSDEFCERSIKLRLESEALNAMMEDLQEMYTKNQKSKRELWSDITAEYGLKTDRDYMLNTETKMIVEKR